jgi:probable DNA metabolism protein
LIVRIAPTFESWRTAARPLLANRVDPRNVTWDDGEAPVLPLTDDAPPAAGTAAVSLPRKFMQIAERVAAHRQRDRWSVLYRVAFRLAHEDRELLADAADVDVAQLLSLDQQIGRDIHKMHAFVRFKRIESEEGERFVAWHRPDHRILRLAIPFFVDRFRTMKWSILTPDESAHFDGTELTFAAGVSVLDAPREDEYEAMWRAYYASTFNPARLNVTAMRAEMPTRFWNQLPELKELAKLIEDAPGAVQRMVDLQRSARNASSWVPAQRDLDTLAAAAQRCEGCDLYQHATQAVFGEGPPSARVVVVGEQPGDEEDRTGRPFVGPAGQLLDRALAEAGLDRSTLYVTNAVKHFAFEERGTKRIHRTPRTSEVTACRPWLAAEIEALDPAVILCVGATAARAVAGPTFRLLEERGEFLQTKSGRTMIATLHPSAVLRADEELAAQYYAWLVADLTRVRERISG